MSRGIDRLLLVGAFLAGRLPTSTTAITVLGRVRKTWIWTFIE